MRGRPGRGATNLVRVLLGAQLQVGDVDGLAQARLGMVGVAARGRSTAPLDFSSTEFSRRRYARAARLA